jgi:hypothetical protein
MPYTDGRITLAARLERFKDNVRIASERRDALKNDWTTVYNYFRSEPDTTYDPNGYQLQVNFPYAWYESMVPSLVQNNPKFVAEPLTPESEEMAKTVETAITQELRVTKFRDRTLRPTIWDALLCGVGIFQLGYYDSGLIPGRDRTRQDTPTDVSQPGPLRSSDMPYGIKPGQIYTLPIRPWNFLIDPGATRLDNALWCGVEYVRDLEGIKKDPQYTNTEKLEADETEVPYGTTDADFRARYRRDPERRLVRLIQYWDIIDRKTYVFTRDHDKLLGTFPFTMPVDRFPFYVIHGTDDNETFWSQSPMIPWLNLVEEYNITISNRLDHLNRFKRKYLYDKDRVSEQDIDALLHPQDGTCIGVSGNGMGVAGAIEPLQDANVSNDSYAFTAEIRQRFTEISGMSEFDMGGSRPGERPAAEINRISASANARRQATYRRVQSTLEHFAGDLRAVMERYYDKERVVKLTGDRGETIWAKYDGSGLAGEYLFHCRIEDMAARSSEERMAQAGQALQLLTPFSQAGSPMPLIDIRPQLREIAKELDVELRFMPETSPMMDPGQEWFTMLKKGAELLPNEQDDHEWHIFVHEQQLELPETIRSPSTVERLTNHLEAHRGMLFAQQQAMQGMQQVQQRRQQGGGGSPGPAPGMTNNPSGGAGLAAMGGGSTPQAASGGATGQNIQELLRGGFG